MFDWKFNHLGMMVTDRDEILSYYQSIGLGVSVGPQPLLPYIEGEGEITFFRELEGDPVSHKYKTGGAHNFKDGQSQIGNCQLEIYPMKPGPGMFISRYLEKKGDGINHIAFNTKDIERDTQYFIDRGCELVFNVTTNGKTIENYIDTRLHGDLMISLRPSADDWEKSWRKNNESHPMVNDWSFLGLGICVDDLESASAYYSHLGYSKLNGINDRREWGVSFQEYSVSKILFELMQAEKGSIYSSSLKQRGEGVAELIFEVSDLKKEIDRLVGKGAEILQISDDNKTASMGSGMKGNILTRLVQMS
jgi:catechol 2,3-dioxygenase-like lactoylglutathione lyase family enzyme